MNEWMNEWINEWLTEWMNEWMNERMNEWTNEWTNKGTNEWIISSIELNEFCHGPVINAYSIWRTLTMLVTSRGFDEGSKFLRRRFLQLKSNVRRFTIPACFHRSVRRTTSVTYAVCTELRRRPVQMSPTNLALMKLRKREKRKRC